MADQPWARLPSETVPAYAAFATARDLGAVRSNAKVAQAVRKNKALIDRWSRRHHWVERLALYDAHLDQIAQASIETEVVKMARRHVQLASLIQSKAIETLNTLKDGKGLTAIDAVRAVEIAAKLERLSRGESTESVTVGGTVGTVSIPLDDESADAWNRILARLGHRKELPPEPPTGGAS